MPLCPRSDEIIQDAEMSHNISIPSSFFPGLKPYDIHDGAAAVSMNLQTVLLGGECKLAW
jgi:hypothetical protein